MESQARLSGNKTVRELGPWQSDTCWKALCILSMAGILILGLKGNLVLLPNKKRFLLSPPSLPFLGSKVGQTLAWLCTEKWGMVPVVCSEPWSLIPTFGMMDMCLPPCIDEYWSRKTDEGPGLEWSVQSSAVLSQFHWLLEICLACKGEQVVIRFGL